MRGGHARRWVAATLAGAVAAGPAPGLPGAEDALAAHGAAAEAVRGLQSGAELPDPGGATGAAVTVRVGGRVAGYGSSMADEGFLTRATREAVAAFLESDQAPRDATRRSRLLELAGTAAVEVELAGRLTPLGGDTFADAASGVSPGLEGVAVRMKGETRGVFPGRMLGSNTPPGRALAAACAGFGLERAPLGELRRREGARVYRFETTALAPVERGGAPVFLHRGGRVRPLSSVVGGELRAFGGRLAGALIDRVWPGEEPVGMLGTYDPTLDEFDPLIAAERERSLGALALARWWAVTGDGASAGAARAVLGDYAEATSGLAPARLDAAGAALALLAIDELGARDEWPALFERCAARARGAGEGELGLSARGAVAAALTRLGDEGARERASAVIADAGRGGLVSAAPWVVWAAAGSADGTAVGAPALREAREVVWEHQVTRSDAGAAEPDLVGGVVFTASSRPLPSAQTARAAALAAAMLGEPSLTGEGERARELARLLPTLRFLRQLTVEEAEARMFPNPARAKGAVRLALWDQRQPVEASAMALIVVAETLEATK